MSPGSMTAGHPLWCSAAVGNANRRWAFAVCVRWHTSFVILVNLLLRPLKARLINRQPTTQTETDFHYYRVRVVC